jgi:hypothetical protein
MWGRLSVIVIASPNVQRRRNGCLTVVNIGFLGLNSAPTGPNGQNSHFEGFMSHEWSCELVASTV